MRSTVADRIERLQIGFDVAQLGVFVPWLISKNDLYTLIPKSQFTTSAGGCWPQLKFSLFGFEALFDLNFVSDPAGRLTEIRLCNYHPRKLRRAFRSSSRFLVAALGTPNLVSISRGQLSWGFGELRVQSYITKHFIGLNTKGKNVHVLSVSQGLWKHVG